MSCSRFKDQRCIKKNRRKIYYNKLHVQGGVVAEWLSAWLPHRRVSSSNLGEDWDF